MTKTDEEIINLYKNGNKEVFKDLIDKYTSPLFNFVARSVGKNNAPDILQEVFIKVWKNLEKFDSQKASFKTWIFTITKNTTIDFLKKKKNILFSDIGEENEYFSENIKDESVLPDEILQKLQDFDLLNKSIDSLPENYKNILVLHYQEEMTFLEIGKVLNKPLNTVKSYHQRAIIKLREML